MIRLLIGLAALLCVVPAVAEDDADANATRFERMTVVGSRAAPRRRPAR
jgi:hypothetical protein